MRVTSKSSQSWHDLVEKQFSESAPPEQLKIQIWRHCQIKISIQRAHKKTLFDILPGFDFDVLIIQFPIKLPIISLHVKGAVPCVPSIKTRKLASLHKVEAVSKAQIVAQFNTSFPRLRLSLKTEKCLITIISPGPLGLRRCRGLLVGFFQGLWIQQGIRPGRWWIFFFLLLSDFLRHFFALEY